MQKERTLVFKFQDKLSFYDKSQVVEWIVEFHIVLLTEGIGCDLLKIYPRD